MIPDVEAMVGSLTGGASSTQDLPWPYRQPGVSDS